MFKIGDFSRLSQVSVRMLRHYDQLGLLKPGHVDKWTGYRYYTLDQLARLNRIVALNGLGLTLQQIGDLIDKDDAVSVERLRGMLTMRRAALEQELMDTQFQLASVEARLRQIEAEGRPSPYEIVVKAVEPAAVASLRQVVPTVAEVGYYCEHLYSTLYQSLAEARLRPLEPEITLYHAQEFRETDLDMETAVVVDPHDLTAAPPNVPFSLHELPALETAATLVFKGSFHEVVHPILALLAWIAEHGRVPDGPLRELHLSGPAHLAGAQAEPPVIELQMPVRVNEDDAP